MVSEVQGHRGRWGEVEAALQAQLDPIDWATYEPHLATNIAAFCGRAAVLLGSLLQMARIPPCLLLDNV